MRRAVGVFDVVTNAVSEVGCVTIENDLDRHTPYFFPYSPTTLLSPSPFNSQFAIRNCLFDVKIRA